MDQPGGKTMILGQWRVVLRQAEESAQAGRYDEALALAARPDIADFRQAIQLRSRLTQELASRATRRAQADDLAGAIDDINLAERFGISPDTLAATRMKLAETAAESLRIDLEAGEPGRVIDRIEVLSRQRLAGPTLRRLRETAEAWQRAREDLRVGEFGRARDHFDRAQRLSDGMASAALAAARADLDDRQTKAAPRIEQLYKALESDQWSEIQTAAEAVLQVVAEHPAARQARAQAWQRIGAYSNRDALPRRGGVGSGKPAAMGMPLQILSADDSRTEDSASNGRLPFQNPGPSGRFLLWADSVGGFLVCLDSEVVIGRAAADSQADIPLLGDLSRRHASIIRSEGGYVLRAHHDTYINGRRVEGESALRPGDVIRLGSSVELEFLQPSPVSSTARLEIVSRHRLTMAVDAVILMGETCIMGPTNQAHIAAPGLEAPVVLYRQGTSLWCRAPGEFDVDGRTFSSRAAVQMKSNVLGEGFSFSLEPLSSSTALA